MPVRFRYFNSEPPKPQIVSNVLSENSWSTISAVANAHKANEYWNVGDEIDISFGSYGTYPFQIYGFDIDDKADGSGKAGVTFGMKDLYSTYATPSTEKPTTFWSESDIRTKTLVNLFDNMQSDARSVVKTVNKKTFRRESFGAEGSIETTEDKLFLFAEGEVIFNNMSEAMEYDLLTRYPIFIEQPWNKQKRLHDNYLEAGWWVRSVALIGTYWCVINMEGEGSYLGVRNPAGLCFGFCV